MLDYYRVHQVQKRGCLELLLYEIQGLVCVWPEDAQDQNDLNIRLEAFLVHARNLLDFLAGNARKSTDITCLKFKEKDGETFKKGAFKVPDHVKLKDAIDKHLNHLSEIRSATKYAWNVAHIREAICEQLRAFVGRLSDEDSGGMATKHNIRNLLQ